jgi:type VI protein secretion system component VasK
VDQGLVERVRRFLWAFGEVDPFYRSMISDAGQGIPSMRFADLFPGSAGVVAAREDIPGAFTRVGWDEVQSRLANPEDLLQTEVWVLGQEARTPDPSALAVALRSRYEAEYASRWLAFLAGASVVPFSNAADGAVKLGVLSGSESPLLRLFFLTARNTSTGSQALEAIFQPVHFVTPSDSVTETPFNETNQPYRLALGMLGSSLEEAAGASGAELRSAQDQVRAQVRQARSASQQIATGFAGAAESSAVANEVLRLLENPVDEADNSVERTVVGTFADQVQPFCRDLSRTLGLYPFSGDPSAPSATLENMAGMFLPENSTLWALYNDYLEPLLDPRGSGFVPKVDAPFELSPAFVEAFNRAWRFSRSLYRTSESEPEISFTFRPRLPESTESVTLVFAGQTYRFTRTQNVTATIDWDGRRAGEVRLLARVNGVERTLAGPWYDDPWAIFRLFQAASGWEATGNRHAVQWTVERDGQVLSLGADVELLGLPPIFGRDYFAGMRCPRTIVR